MNRLLQFCFFVSSVYIYCQTISGIVLSEDDVLIPKVLVVNMNNNQKTNTDNNGRFVMNANQGDEIRFAKELYKLSKVRITSNNFITVKLEKIPKEIEEVTIVNKNSSYSRNEELRKAIGLPKNPEKPREKPYEAVDDILKPLIGIPPKLNIQAIYDVVSGKSRRLKRLYKYEDLQEGLEWIKKNVDPNYFTDAGIKPEKMNDFLMFCLKDEKVLMFMKAKNVGGITYSLDSHIEEYLKVVLKK